MDLMTKYRPQTFDEVVGHKKVIKTLKEILSDRTLLPHSYLFVGPSGVGKTTLARILSRELGCKSYNLIEQDSVSNSSIDYYRDLLENMPYPALGGSPYRILILDEAQVISKTVWQSIVSEIEEAPSHEFFIFCCTEASKLPDILLTRVHTFRLNPLSKIDILEQLYKIKIAENFSISDDELEKLSEYAQGSMRKAISLLSSTRNAGNSEHLYEDTLENMPPEILDFCRRVIFDAPPSFKEYFKFDAELLRSTLIMYATHTFFLKNPLKNFVKWNLLMSVLSGPLDNGMPELVARLSSLFPELFAELNKFHDTIGK